MSTDLEFPAGAMLTVTRDTRTYDALGSYSDTTETVGTIGPCSIADTRGQYSRDDDKGEGKWVGTVSVKAPPGTDIRAGDHVTLPSGEVAVVTGPPERPVNPFTGWAPFIAFRLATPGAEPSRVEGDNPLG